MFFTIFAEPTVISLTSLFILKALLAPLSFALILALRKAPTSVVTIYRETARASVVNLVLPFIGTTTKLLQLKSESNLSLRKSGLSVGALLVVRSGLGGILAIAAFIGISFSDINGTNYLFASVLLASLALFLVIFMSAARKFQIVDRVTKGLLLIVILESILLVFDFVVFAQLLRESKLGITHLALLIGIGAVLSVIPSGFGGVGFRELGIVMVATFSQVDSEIIANALIFERFLWALSVAGSFVIISAAHAALARWNQN